jgi:hypothetical protein
VTSAYDYASHAEQGFIIHLLLSPTNNARLKLSYCRARELFALPLPRLVFYKEEHGFNGLFLCGPTVRIK